MSYADLELARLIRSRAMRRDMLRRNAKALTKARARHIELAARVERDETKIEELTREIDDLGG